MRDVAARAAVHRNPDARHLIQGIYGRVLFIIFHKMNLILARPDDLTILRPLGRFVRVLCPRAHPRPVCGLIWRGPEFSKRILGVL